MDVVKDLSCEFTMFIKCDFAAIQIVAIHRKNSVEVEKTEFILTFGKEKLNYSVRKFNDNHIPRIPTQHNYIA